MGIPSYHGLPCGEVIVIGAVPAIEDVGAPGPVGIVVNGEVAGGRGIVEGPTCPAAAEDVVVIGLVASAQKVESTLTGGGAAVEGIVVPFLVLAIVVEGGPAVHIAIGCEEVIGNDEGTARYTVHVIEVHGAALGDGNGVIADLAAIAEVLQVEAVVVVAAVDGSENVVTNDRRLMPLLVADAHVVLVAEGIADEFVAALALPVAAGPAVEVEAIGTSGEEVVLPAVVLIVLVGIAPGIGVEEGIV